MCCYPWPKLVCPIDSKKRNPTVGYGTDHEELNYFWLLPAYFYWAAVHTGFVTDTLTRWCLPYSCWCLQTNKMNRFTVRKQPKQNIFLKTLPLDCKEVGSDEPEYCKFPLAPFSLRTVKLSLSLADSINRLASLSVMPSETEWLLIFSRTSPSWRLFSPPNALSLTNILLPKTMPKSEKQTKNHKFTRQPKTFVVGHSAHYFFYIALSQHT